MIQPIPPVLRPDGLAELLGLSSERAARNFLRRHRIPCLRDGNRILVLTSVLLDRIRELSDPEGAEPPRGGRRGLTVRQAARRLGR